LDQGLLGDGTERELHAEGVEPFMAESFSSREAAAALGRTLLTLRTWIKAESIPAPIFSDTTYGWPQYLREELEAIAGVLAVHEQHFRYLRRDHEDTVARIADEVNAARVRLFS